MKFKAKYTKHGSTEWCWDNKGNTPYAQVWFLNQLIADLTRIKDGVILEAIEKKESK